MSLSRKLDPVKSVGLKTIGAILNVSVFSVVARNYNINVFGEYAYLYSLCVIGSLAMSLGWQKYIVRQYKINIYDQDRAIKYMFPVILVFTIAFVLFFFSLILFGLKNKVVVDTIVWLILIAVSMAGNNLLTAKFRANNCANLSVFLEFVARPLTFLLIVMIMGYWLHPIIIFAIAAVVSFLISIVVFKISNLNDLNIAEELEGKYKSLVAVVKTSVWLHILAIANILFNQADVLVIGSTLSLVEVGQFKIATQLALSMNLVLAGVVLYYQPKIAQFAAQSNIKSAERIARKASLQIILISLPIYIVVILFPIEVVKLVFGGKVDVSSELVRWVMSAVMTNFIVGCTGVIINMFGKEKVIVVLNLVLGCVYILLVYFYSGHYGVVFVGFMFFMISLFKNVLLYFYVRENIGVRILF